MVSESQTQLATGHHRLERTPAFAADQTPAGLVPVASPHRHLDPPLEAAPAPAQPNLQRKAVAASSPSEVMLPLNGRTVPSPCPSTAVLQCLNRGMGKPGTEQSQAQL